MPVNTIEVERHGFFMAGQMVLSQTNLARLRLSLGPLLYEIRFIPFEGSLYSCLTMQLFERKSVREISVIHPSVTLCEMKYSDG